MTEARPTADRMQGALVRLSRLSRASGVRGRMAPVPVRVPVRVPVHVETKASPPPQAPPQTASEAPFEEVLERLERIEERLTDLQRPQKAIPASRDLFGEWVRLRTWEEIGWGDFLKLRRLGRI